MFTVENFITGLGNVLPRLLITQNEDKLLISIKAENNGLPSDQNDVVGEIEFDEIQEIANEISMDATFMDNFLYKKTSYESPLKPLNNIGMSEFRLFEREMCAVSEHNYEFLVSKASSQYIFALLCSLSANDSVNFDPIPLYRYRIIRREDTIKSLEELCDIFRILTAKIIAPVECSLSEFKKMLQSYLFNISYNDNMVFSISDLSKDRQPMRRSIRREGQYFPYKSYNVELVKYYYQGASADIPFTQYLAFYHVAEFFFQTISEQDAFHEIEEFITRPSFSPRRKEDIRQFYDKMKKKMRVQREDGVWDEKTGLLLCLKKYVPDIEILRNSINAIDVSAIDYYKTNDVSFADEAKPINFNDTSEAIYTILRNRVYSVRNAIVHSKEGKKLRYEPFKHDKELSKEIPLIRAIAEEIIINSAKVMDIKTN